MVNIQMGEEGNFNGFVLTPATLRTCAEPCCSVVDLIKWKAMYNEGEKGYFGFLFPAIDEIPDLFCSE